MRFRVKLTGHTELRSGGGVPVTMGTQKAWALLAYLCMAAPRAVPRDELADLLWPRSNTDQARASLRQELSVLRKALAQAGLNEVSVRRETVSISFNVDQVDVLFAARRLSSHDQAELSSGLDALDGELLETVRIRSNAFEDWLQLERQALRNSHINAARHLLQSARGNGDNDHIIDCAQKLLAIDATQEPAYRALMRAYFQQGRATEALRLYRECEAILRRELDTVPSFETRALADEIRQDMGSVTVARLRNSQRKWLIVASFGLTLPKETNALVDPEHLAQAQEQFQQRVRRGTEPHSGEILQGLGDRVVVVFGNRMNVDRALSTDIVRSALNLVAQPVGLSKDLVLWPRVGLAGSDMLVSTQAGALVLVGEGLLRSTEALSLAPRGSVAADHQLAPALGDWQASPLLPDSAPRQYFVLTHPD